MKFYNQNKISVVTVNHQLLTVNYLICITKQTFEQKREVTSP